MEFSILLELLKLLWIGFGVVKYFIDRKREKALVTTLASFDQRLKQLEKELRLKP